MELLGTPFIIQNTKGRQWLVTWNDAVTHGTKDEVYERISFTVSIPRKANLSIEEVQVYALKRAEELLQVAIRGKKSRTPGR